MKTQSTLDLYRRRLAMKLQESPIEEQQTVNEAWRILQGNILEAANEALGKGTVKSTTHQFREKS